MRETSCGLAAQPGLNSKGVETLSSRAREEEILFPLKSPKRWHRGVCRKSVIVAQVTFVSYTEVSQL